MLKFRAANYVRICAGLQAMRHAVSSIDPASPASRRLLMPLIESVSGPLVELDLKISMAQLERIVFAVTDMGMKHGQFVDAVKELEVRIMDEMDGRLYLCLDPHLARYFDTRNLFGENVATAFPSAVVDIEEAGSCLALGRYTGCVLHLMRAMESAIHALAARIGVRYEYRGWDPVIKKMRSELEKKYEDMDPPFKGSKEYLGNALDRLTGVKEALRNPTMHARINYDAERAEDVFRAVRTFMQLCAEQLAEEQKDGP